MSRVRFEKQLLGRVQHEANAMLARLAERPAIPQSSGSDLDFVMEDTQ